MDAASTDAALLAATARGDMGAFERLHRRFHPRVLGFAMRLVGRFEIAEEVTGDTMMTVWRKASDFRGEARPSTWIFGIAYRTALKARRKAEPDKLHDELDETIPSARSGTEEVEMMFQRERIAAALAQLSAEHRAVVELTYFYGYRVAEIAEIVDCPQGTVKTRMFHARQKLRQLLEDAGGETGAEGAAKK